MNTPRLRFNGFSGPWQTAKIKDYLTESRIPGSKGDTAKKISVKRWGKGVVEKHTIRDGSDNTQYYIRKEGQFIYGKLDFLLGALGIVPKELDGFESTVDSPAFDISPEIYPYYLDCYTQREKFYLGYGNIANGSRKARRVHAEDFYEMPLIFPAIDEQKKIASFFLALNKKIELQQEKIDLLKEQKKGFMQKIFSQELRFKDEDGQEFPEWISKNLGEIFDFYNGKAHEKDIDKNGKYVIVNSKFISTEGKIKKYSNELIFPLKKDDIVMVMSDVPNGKAIAKCYLIEEDEKYTLNQRICCLRTSMDSVFFLNQINRNKFYLKFDDGVNQTNLRKEDILNCPLKVPCIEEQIKIADFFTILDIKIQNEIRKFEFYKIQKQAFMQQMFI